MAFHQSVSSFAYARHRARKVLPIQCTCSTGVSWVFSSFHGLGLPSALLCKGTVFWGQLDLAAGLLGIVPPRVQYIPSLVIFSNDIGAAEMQDVFLIGAFVHREGLTDELSLVTTPMRKTPCVCTAKSVTDFSTWGGGNCLQSKNTIVLHTPRV